MNKMYSRRSTNVEIKILKFSQFCIYIDELVRIKNGLVRDLNPGPLAPKARIIPLDQRAMDTNESRQY